jgi:hypothetical protein
MLNDDEADTASFGDMTEELFQGLQTTRRSAKSDDREGETCGVTRFLSRAARAFVSNKGPAMSYFLHNSAKPAFLRNVFVAPACAPSLSGISALSVVP